MLKKLAVLLAVLAVFSTFSYAAEPREYIAETAPKEFLIPFGDLVGVAVESFEFASKGDGKIDYGLMIYETNYGTVHSFFSLVTEKNQAGELVIKDSKNIALILIDANAAWYQSAEVKQIYNSAIKAYTATK